MGRKRTVVVAVVAIIVAISLVITAFLVLFPAQPKREPGIPDIYPYCNDLAGALDQDSIDLIDYIGTDVNDNNSCELAVLVVNTTQPYSIDHFALRAFQYNAIGKAGQDNGVLIVVATDDATWRIEVGYGLEGILVDTRVNRLAQEDLVPNMTEGSYGEGLVSLSLDIGIILEDEYHATKVTHSDRPIQEIPLSWSEWLLVGAAIVILSVITRGRILWPIAWIISALLGGRGGFGGGRSGGGGASGRR